MIGRQIEDRAKENPFVDVDELRASLRAYETVIDTMHCGLIAEDTDGTVIFANQRLLDWLGYTKQEVVGQSVAKLVPSELRDLVDQDLAAAESGDFRARLLAVRRKDSTTFPVVSLPQQLLDDAGRCDGYFYIVVDLGAVLTAKQLGASQEIDLRSRLHRIAMELASIGAAAELPAGSLLPLDHPAMAEVSPREAEVLSALMTGDRVHTIAGKLHISQHTVRNHLKSLFRKLDVTSQAELMERVRRLATET